MFGIHPLCCSCMHSSTTRHASRAREHLCYIAYVCIRPFPREKKSSSVLRSTCSLVYHGYHGPNMRSVRSRMQGTGPVPVGPQLWGERAPASGRCLISGRCIFRVLGLCQSCRARVQSRAIARHCWPVSHATGYLGLPATPTHLHTQDTHTWVYIHPHL